MTHTAVETTIETEEHALTLTVPNLPRIPNEYGGDAQVTRLRVLYHADANGELHPAGIEFLDTAQDGCFLAPAAWEQPNGWPTWLRDFTDHHTPRRSGPGPAAAAASVENHRVTVRLNVAGFPPLTGPDHQQMPVCQVRLIYRNAVATALRFTVDSGEELFVGPADLEEPQRLPRAVQHLIDTFRPAAYGD